MTDETGANTIQDRYAQQVTTDLEKNRAEQQEVTAQLQTLHTRLEHLRLEETWLAGVQASLAGPGGAQDSSPADDEADCGSSETPEQSSLPQQLGRTRKKAAQPAGGRRTAQKKTAAETATKKVTAKKTSAQAAGAKSAVSTTTTPVLGVLLKAIVDGHAGQPRTALEIGEELERRYPERARAVTIVRNTLERLVAKSEIERTRQKRTVLYSSTDRSAAQTITDGSAAEGERAAASA
ncbi:hypothetical protein ABZ920_01625 [Streptomyces sp. NPDC046831]|uniref:hypothetical protein n=1 Tax=Streptomyces sp. NPDC046831 TaxID=3154805 RepID=UPI0033E44C46